MTPSTTFRNIAALVVPPAFWLGVWQLGALFMGKELFLPTPAAVGAALAALAVTPLFWQTALVTLARIFVGFLAGVALGAVLAALTHASVWADRIFSPAIRVIRATPVASFILLIYVWVKSARVPGVVAALMVLPVVWGNLSRAMREIDPLLLEVAGAYRFSRGKRLRLVIVPSLLPYFSSACNTALGLSWKAGVAAEVLCQPPLSVGGRVYAAKLALDTPSLFAWTFVVIGLSLLLEHGMGRLFRAMERGRAV